MSNIDKIRQEIERLKQMGSIGLNEYDAGFENGRGELCDELLAFIDSLPEEKPSEDLEEEIQGMYQAIFGTDIINRREMVYLETFDMIARHFAEWGAKHKKSLQVQETCKENQDSFTDKPKELEEAANEWILSHNDGDVLYVKNAFKDGAKWMANQMLEREDRNDDTLPRFYGD